MGTAKSACGTPGEHHHMVSSLMTGLLQPWSTLKAPPGGSGSTCSSSTQSQRLATRDTHNPCVISAVPCPSNNAVSYCQHLLMPDPDTLSSSVSLTLFSSQQISDDTPPGCCPASQATNLFWPVGNTAAWKKQKLWGEANITNA